MIRCFALLNMTQKSFWVKRRIFHRKRSPSFTKEDKNRNTNFPPFKSGSPNALTLICSFLKELSRSDWGFKNLLNKKSSTASGPPPLQRRTKTKNTNFPPFWRICPNTLTLICSFLKELSRSDWGFKNLLNKKSSTASGPPPLQRRTKTKTNFSPFQRGMSEEQGDFQKITFTTFQFKSCPTKTPKFY